MSQEDFNKSELHQHAVLRLIQIIGEAARLVSEETRIAHPEVEWHKISGMRNQVIHHYFEINLDTVWQVISTDLDILISQIEPLLPPDDEI